MHAIIVGLVSGLWMLMFLFTCVHGVIFPCQQASQHKNMDSSLHRSRHGHSSNSLKGTMVCMHCFLESSR